MAGDTPRRSMRIPHTHTPKLSERKKGLFQLCISTPDASKESLSKHRRLPVVASDSDSDDCDLGIISTLDSSSGDEFEQNVPKTPERNSNYKTKQANKLLLENQDLKNFIKSPFTLKKYQTRYSCPDSKCTGSLSTPATPHIQNHPSTPSSTHSCASIHTTSSTSSKARKSLASLIADTESCSSSLKDLNFDTDSGSESKENTPIKPIRKSSRKKKMTPKYQSFKGTLVEQKNNSSPKKEALVCLTKIDSNTIISPTQMQKTPHNISMTNTSPPKIGHNRRPVIEIDESPESACDSDKSHKRLRNESISDPGPNSKLPKLDTAIAPKARVSLFNSDRLKEILSAKSFYGKKNPELNINVVAKISSAIETTNTYHRKSFHHSQSSRRKKRPGQINMGVRHKIRKPKMNKYNVIYRNVHSNKSVSSVKSELSANTVLNNTSMISQDLDNDKPDPFDTEKKTIEALLSQWTEEEVPRSELAIMKNFRHELPCFSNTIMEETNPIFAPVTAIPVIASQELPSSSETVIVELGSDKTVIKNVDEKLEQVSYDVVMAEGDHASVHGEVPKSGQFLPVEGGFIFVDQNQSPAQEDLPDLDEIERELKMLDEQILQMAENNNINAQAVLASTETTVLTDSNKPASPSVDNPKEKTEKLFSIFNKPNPGIIASNAKVITKKKKILKNGADQYIIDAGQKKFGVTQCTECGVMYQVGDYQDEQCHLVHHNATDILRFNGWKEEYIVGRWGEGRCLRVRGGDGAAWKKVAALLQQVVHPCLGYPESLSSKQVHVYTGYLYIEKKKIIGCAIVEPITRAVKYLPGDIDCCTMEDYPVKCGVSRIWTHINHQRKGIARKMMECVRTSLLYGTVLEVTDFAFTSPTEAGKAFITKYCGTPNFYIYFE